MVVWRLGVVVVKAQMCDNTALGLGLAPLCERCVGCSVVCVFVCGCLPPCTCWCMCWLALSLMWCVLVALVSTCHFCVLCVGCPCWYLTFLYYIFSKKNTFVLFCFKSHPIPQLLSPSSLLSSITFVINKLCFLGFVLCLFVGCSNRNSSMVSNFFSKFLRFLPSSSPILNHENVLDIVGNVAALAGEGNLIRVCCAFALVLPRHTLTEF